MIADPQSRRTTVGAASRLNIDKLVQAGILTEIGDRSRNKQFLAREVLAAVEGPTTDQLG